ncbi:MAG: hypothetical protein HFE26_00325 [Clostridia bacterium]|nr:hypothetical protein [Clostridia bacterium]
MSSPKYDSKENLDERFENMCSSNNGLLSREPESPDEAYEIWKDDKNLSDPSDYDWDDGAPSVKDSEDNIRESYDRMYENEDEDE